MQMNKNVGQMYVSEMCKGLKLCTQNIVSRIIHKKNQFNMPAEMTKEMLKHKSYSSWS